MIYIKMNFAIIEKRVHYGMENVGLFNGKCIWNQTQMWGILMIFAYFYDEIKVIKPNI